MTLASRETYNAMPVKGDPFSHFDLETEKAIRTIPHPDGVFGVAWHPDGKSLAAACEDTQVYVWDAEAGKREMVLEGHHAQVTKVAFNRSGSLLASRSWDKTTRLWDMTSGDLLVRVPGRHVGFSRHDDHRLGFHSGIWRIGSGQECRDIQIPGRSSGGDIYE